MAGDEDTEEREGLPPSFGKDPGSQSLRSTPLGPRSDFQAHLCAHPEAELALSLERTCESLQAGPLGYDLLGMPILDLESGRLTKNQVGIVPPSGYPPPTPFRIMVLQHWSEKGPCGSRVSVDLNTDPILPVSGVGDGISQTPLQAQCSRARAGNPQPIRAQGSLKHDSIVLLQMKPRPSVYEGLAQTHTAALRVLNSFKRFIYFILYV